jgi:DNA-binding transcriptional MerR regulator/quercetin dioxygenase-like cupin family protein
MSSPAARPATHLRATHPLGAKAAPTAPASFRIAEAARRIGVSASALRQWERQGLVHPARTRAGYRLYSGDDLHRLQRVRRMRQEERVNAPGIRRLLGGSQSHATPGRRLRELRAQAGLSLRTAAERSGLSVSFVSSLERGASGASVAALQRLVAAYGATVLELFGGSRPSRRVVRSGRGDVLEISGSGTRIEQLSRGTSQLEPQLFVLAPGASSDGAYAHVGEEFLHVLTGSLTVWVGDDERYRLRTGDSLSFPSNLPHRWRNDASGETRLLWINTPPTF